MFARALCGVLLIALSAWPGAAQTDAPPPTPRMSRPPQPVSRVGSSALGAPVCRPGERQCAIGTAITWCCRADQQCDYSYPGACK
jgi:hypothetical protein